MSARSVNLAVLLLACSAVCVAQAPQIKSGPTVYIEPMNGYETYLAAAFAKKHVPLIVVADESKAQYILRSNVNQVAPTHPAVVINNSNTASVGDNNTFNGARHGGYPAPRDFGHTSASVSLIDPHTSQILFAYSVEKSSRHQEQSDAEAAAKHLKDFLTKKQK